MQFILTQFMPLDTGNGPDNVRKLRVTDIDFPIRESSPGILI